MALCLASAFFLSCSSDDDEKLPDGVIEDSSGLSFTLEWTTGSTSTQALEDADLDIYLYNSDDDLVSGSQSSQDFETMELSHLLADDEYYVTIYPFTVDANTTFTLYVEGTNSGTSYSYSGTFTSSDDENGSYYPDFINIVKSGNTYTITQ